MAVVGSGAGAPNFSAETSCLLIVDVQARLLPAILDRLTIISNVIRLAKAAQFLGVPVLATEQNSRGLGVTEEALGAFASIVLPKTHFDATREASWPSFLPSDRTHVVVVGTEAHVCVLQTVMGLMRSGREVRLVCDAVGSRTADNKERGLQRAQRHGAELVTTEMIVFEWLEHCDHQCFREALKLIK